MNERSPVYLTPSTIQNVYSVHLDVASVGEMFSSLLQSCDCSQLGISLPELPPSKIYFLSLLWSQVVVGSTLSTATKTSLSPATSSNLSRGTPRNPEMLSLHRLDLETLCIGSALVRCPYHLNFFPALDLVILHI